MPTSRRGLPKYKQNPFLAHTSTVTKTGYKPVYTSVDGAIRVFNDITGEVSGAAIAVKKEVDKAEFIKLYAEGVAALLNLKSPGKKVFAIIYSKISGSEGMNRTEVSLVYEMLPDEQQKFVSRTTFYRGIKECLKWEIIAQTLQSGTYFINPAFIFNGDRLTIVKQFIIREEKRAEPATRETLSDKHDGNLFENMEN